MSRLINADELLNFFDNDTSGTNDIIWDLVDEYSNVDGNIYEDEAVDMLYDFLGKVKNVIKTESTVEVEPVKHGYWDNQDKCSVCGYGVMPWNNTVKYCPNCGAKMDEV